MSINSGKKTGLGQVFLLTGALLGFLIGSGVATGQELMQYYTPYGYWTFGTAAIIAFILIVANYGFAYAGNLKHFEKGSQVFGFYCGPVVGKIFDWFTVLFCYMSYIVMIGGGSATLHQQYGIPLFIGGIMVAVLAAATVAFGLNIVVNLVGRIAHLVIILILLIGLISLIQSFGSLPENIARAQANEIEMVKAADNWFLSGVSNGGFCILWLAGFVAALGSREDFSTLMKGNIASSIALVIINSVIGFAILANIDAVKGLQIPSLYLATQIWPPLAHIFGILIFGAIYTTACPLLWTASSRFTTEGTANFKIANCLLAAFGLIIALYVPYSILMNYIYVINGYLGAIMFAIMVIRMVMMRMKVSPAPSAS